jgi:mono/diheme cytochrome c family protein
MGRFEMYRGTGIRHGVDRRWQRLLVVCLLALLTAAGANGCGSDSSSGDDAAAAARERAQAAAHARRLETGRRVFAKHCETCHTLAGKHFTRPIIEFEAPNLDEVRLRRVYVEGRVAAGGPAMASFSSEIPEHGIRGVIAYVTETAGGKVVDEGDQSPDELAEGKAVFAEHCAGCHAIEGRAATGRPTYPGTDFTLAKPSERFVMDRVKNGVVPEEPMMPAFGKTLTDAQIRAVATYVTAVAGEGAIAPQPE